MYQILYNVKMNCASRSILYIFIETVLINIITFCLLTLFCMFAFYRGNFDDIEYLYMFGKVTVPL